MGFTQLSQDIGATAKTRNGLLVHQRSIRAAGIKTIPLKLLKGTYRPNCTLYLSVFCSSSLLGRNALLYSYFRLTQLELNYLVKFLSAPIPSFGYFVERRKLDICSEQTEELLTYLSWLLDITLPKTCSRYL